MASSAESALQVAENKVDELADTDADSTDSELRYMAYGARLRTALRAGTRYVAYVRLRFTFLALQSNPVHSF